MPVVTVIKPNGATLEPAVTELEPGIFEALVTPLITEQGVWRWSVADPDGPGIDPASADSSYFLVRD